MSKLYGVGVGPGDPELMTIKAINAIKRSKIVFFPGKSEDSSIAFNIAKQAIPEIDDKIKICVDFPMTKNPEVLEEAHSKITNQINELLKEGDVALLTLGDPGVYATYSYIALRLKNSGCGNNSRYYILQCGSRKTRHTFDSCRRRAACNTFFIFI